MLLLRQLFLLWLLRKMDRGSLLRLLLLLVLSVFLLHHGVVGSLATIRFDAHRTRSIVAVKSRSDGEVLHPVYESMGSSTIVGCSVHDGLRTTSRCLDGCLLAGLRLLVLLGLSLVVWRLCMSLCYFLFFYYV